MKVELTAIEITVDNEKILMTIDEAKALYRQLREMFGDKCVSINPTPLIAERWPTWPTYPQITWCSSTSEPLPSTFPILAVREIERRYGSMTTPEFL